MSKPIYRTPGPRDITKVIDAMLAVIPTGMLELRNELRAVASKAGYVAPEIMNMVWSNGTEVIARHFPTPDKLVPWQRQVVAIWTGR